MGKLAQAKKGIGRVTDKLNAKMGFLGSAVTGVITTIGGLIGGLTAIKAILLGGGIIAAVVALAYAFKENFAGIRDRIRGLFEWMKGAFESAKSAVLSIWNSFMSGFEGAGGSLSDVETIVSGVLDGIKTALQAVWTVAKPILKALVAAFKPIAKVVAKVIGKVVDVLASLEKEYGVLSKLVTVTILVVGAFITLSTVIPIIISVAGTIAGIISTVVAFVSAAGGLLSAIGSVISIIGGLIAALNPVTVAIVAIIATITALWIAWEENFLGIQDITDDVINGIKSAWDSFMGYMSAAGDMLYDIFVQPFKDIYNAIVGNSIIPDLVNGIKNAIKGAVSMISTAVGLVIDVIKAPFVTLYNFIVGNSLIPDLVNGIADVFKGAVGMIKKAVNTVIDAFLEPFRLAKDELLSLFDGVGDAIASSLKGAFNSVVPNSLSIPKVTVGGGSIAGEDIPKVAIGGGSLDLPQLKSGGIVQQGGMAEIHEGESVIPAEVTKEVMEEGVGGKGSGQSVQVNVGGIEVGDQSLDLSNMSRRDLKQLADLLADKLGDEVRNTTI